MSGTSPAVRQITSHDGVNLVADVYTHDVTNRAAVILLHGGGQNRHAWAATARALHAAGHDVIAYDTRGHGDSDWDPSGRYEMEHLVGSTLAVRAAFAGDRKPVADQLGGNDQWVYAPGVVAIRVQGEGRR